ncbi:polysaccharide deacetylase family protein [Thermoproteota archaeon]
MIKRILGKLVFYLGITFLIDLLLDRGDSGQIISYHSIANQGHYYRKEFSNEFLAKNFENQLRFLSKRFNIMPLKQMVDMLHANKILPPKTIAIVFDDGYRDNFTVALPLLKKLKIPATFFIATDFIESSNMPECDKIAYMIHFTNKQGFTLTELETRYQLTDSKQKHNTIVDIDNKTKDLPTDRRSEIIKTMSHLLEVDPDQEIKDNLCMDWNQVQQLHNDLTQVGSHGCTHKILTKMTLKHAKEEVFSSKEQLQRITSQPITLFSYPSGEYNKDIQRLLVEAGYLCGIGKEQGVNTQETDIYQLKRVFVEPETSIYDLHCYLSKSIQAVNRFLSSFKRIR